MLASIWLAAQFTVAAPAGENKYLGKWSGTYAGQNASGHIDMSLERGREGVITGTVMVTANPGQGFDYTAKFKSASFDGAKFTAIYDPRGDGQTEITLKGVFDPKTAAGDWSMTAKAQPTGEPVAAGTWTIARNRI